MKWPRRAPRSPRSRKWPKLDGRPRAWPFGSLLRRHYGVIYADPPWPFKTRSAKGKGRSPERHYKTMSLRQLAALPMRDLAARNCALVLWVPDNMFEEVCWLLRQWGFKLIGRLFDWPKQTKSGKPAIGLGYYSRHGGEQCWLAIRGAPRRRSRSVRQYRPAPVREHSRKPDEFAGDIMRLFDGPYVELFARTRREGWDCWGNQTDKFNLAEARAQSPRIRRAIEKAHGIGRKSKSRR